MGKLADPKIEQEMTKLHAMVEVVKVLGCYRTRW
jgi:hypothetical protein